jgi:predicted nucleotidyltransferase/predicted XRE-type DNA-binding protein
MSAEPSIWDRLRSDASAADEMQARARRMLREAARLGRREGLTQREIADALGRSQPEVSRLLRFHATSELGRRLVRGRGDVIAILARYGAHRPRVFGSVARGSDGPSSDVDLLVDVRGDVSLFDLARAEAEISDLLGARVDVVPDRSVRASVSAAAVDDIVPL